MITGIRNIIFDLGGVVIDLQKQVSVSSLQKLGLDDAADLLGEYRQNGIFLELEQGTVTAAMFYDFIRHRIAGFGHTEIPDDRQIEDAFSIFLAGLPVERLQAITALRARGIRTFVLSNTNPIMFDGWIKRAFSQEGKRIDDYFDGVVCSYREGMCKPDPNLFRVPLNRYRLDPAETLMLDDGEANCEGARSVGMKAIRIVDNNLLQVLKELDIPAT